MAKGIDLATADAQDASHLAYAGVENPHRSPRTQKATEKVQKERLNIILKFNKTCLRDKQVGAFCCLDLYGHFLGDSYAR